HSTSSHCWEILMWMHLANYEGKWGWKGGGEEEADGEEEDGVGDMDEVEELMESSWNIMQCLAQTASCQKYFLMTVCYHIMCTLHNAPGTTPIKRWGGRAGFPASMISFSQEYVSSILTQNFFSITQKIQKKCSVTQNENYVGEFSEDDPSVAQVRFASGFIMLTSVQSKLLLKHALCVIVDVCKGVKEADMPLYCTCAGDFKLTFSNKVCSLPTHIMSLAVFKQCTTHHNMLN
uniref:DNA polymerase-epsilon zinc finger domain-containing protein n=1 Tax=Salmo trutta TaxID=8032 RepID=A0A674B4T6_SALTR